MSAKTPIRTVFDGSNNATGLAEFQSGEFVALTHGGLGASLSIGSAGQVLKVNSGASALEFGNVEAVLNIDGMTDGTGITIVDGDLLAISDAGTEKRITASQLKSYIGGYDGDITTINIDGGTDIGEDLADADLLIVDNGAGGTNRKTAMSRVKTYIADVTLTTAAQTNITSLGTLTALTVDNIVINGANIGHTSDTDAIAIDSSGNVTLSQNLTITGDFTVNGSTTTVNSTNTTIDDNLLELNSGASSNANDSGIIIERGSTGDNAVVMWDESADQFVVGTTTATASSTGNISHTKADFQAAQITGSSGVFTSTGVSSVMTVTGTDDGSGEGPDIVIKRNSASPADDDILGALVFKGENSADEAVTYGKVRARALDVTDSTEDGQLEFQTIKAGSATTVASLDSTGLFLNTGLTLTFEGAGTNAHETTLTVEDPDGDRTITLPNATGTVVLKDTTDTLTNKTLTAPTMTGTAIAADLDISGNVDVDGTLETDALTIGGTTLAEVISDTVGAMVGSNTESGITVTYDDSDNTLDFTVGTLNQNTTGSAATLTTARTIAGQSFDGSANITIASTDLSNTSAIALLTASQTMTNKTLTSPQINTQVDFLARAEARFQDASGGQYVALEAPATVSSNVTFTLPAADGSSGQVIKTDGSGALSFTGVAQAGFSSSTLVVAPGSSGDFDLTKTDNAGDSESPFDSTSTDTFGVAIGSVFDLMEPTGNDGTTTDFGAFS